jgi:hypothetical protein
LKWLKKQKIRNEVRKSKPLEEKIKENKELNNMDRGQLSKRKKIPTDTLEHLTERRKDSLAKP